MIESDVAAAARRSLGRQLATYRRAAGYNQEQFAPLINYTRSSVANVETGRQKVPRRFWEDCDSVLSTGGILAAGYDQLEAIRRRDGDAAARRMAPLASFLMHGQPVTPADEEPDPQIRSLLGYLATDVAPYGEPAAAAVELALDGMPLAESADLLIRLVFKIDAEQGGNNLYRPLAQFVARMAEQLDEDATTGLAAFGQLNQMTGWLALESGHQGAARRYFSSAVYAAHEADNPSLAASALAYMSLQDTYRDRPKSALSLARTAFETSDGSVTPLMQTMLATRMARAHAAMGNKAASLRSMDRARTGFGRTAQEAEPLWVSYVDEIEVLAQEGACYLELQMPREARSALRQAVDQLTVSAPHRVRDHVHYLSRLAKCDLLDLDVESACQTATDALSLAGTIGSTRVAERLREFHDALAPFGANRAARDFQQQFAESVSAAA